MFPESDLLPISALQHLIYCERQAALIHNERLWAENRHTAEGRLLHDKAHQGRGETRDGVRLVRAVPVRSLRLGLFGVCDVVEFEPPRPSPEGSYLRVTPIEYKRGRPKSHEADRAQLCAQALCLEEMLGVSIPSGQLFYGKTRRRRDVGFDDTLRRHTEQATARLRELIVSGVTPPAVYEKKKCDRCSLISLCMPGAMKPRRTASDAFDRLLRASLSNDTSGNAHK